MTTSGPSDIEPASQSPKSNIAGAIWQSTKQMIPATAGVASEALVPGTAIPVAAFVQGVIGATDALDAERVQAATVEVIRRIEHALEEQRAMTCEMKAEAVTLEYIHSPEFLHHLRQMMDTIKATTVQLKIDAAIANFTNLAVGRIQGKKGLNEAEMADIVTLFVRELPELALRTLMYLPPWTNEEMRKLGGSSMPGINANLYPIRKQLYTRLGVTSENDEFNPAMHAVSMTLDARGLCLTQRLQVSERMPVVRTELGDAVVKAMTLEQSQRDTKGKGDEHS